MNEKNDNTKNDHKEEKGGQPNKEQEKVLEAEAIEVDEELDESEKKKKEDEEGRRFTWPFNWSPWWLLLLLPIIFLILLIPTCDNDDASTSTIDGKNTTTVWATPDVTFNESVIVKRKLDSLTYWIDEVFLDYQVEGRNDYALNPGGDSESMDINYIYEIIRAAGESLGDLVEEYEYSLSNQEKTAAWKGFNDVLAQAEAYVAMLEENTEVEAYDKVTTQRGSLKDEIEELRKITKADLFK